MTKSKAIVPIFESQIEDPRQLDALNALENKRVPKSAVSEHPGKQGETFKYVKHTWITETLQEGLGNAWSYEVEDWEVFPDSAAVRATLTVLIPVNPAARQANDPPFIIRKVTEVGTYDKRDKMSAATMIACASSRCLCRCVMRMFGIGIEFYKKDDEPPSADHAWTTLKEYAKKQGTVWTDEFQIKFIDALKAKDISKENIVDRYAEAYKILNVMIGKVVKDEVMPGG